ncbi:hypothetical protein [Clostridium estertheticum]|uniref:hypothetical protein n=1 Tax=Clostridium estertheticum TaxID=238834 RepID=UPI001C0D555A|nr:hypothetical protein [Clostridium estertheticum]MBU3186536.1 hypothetical protein [Clostridium estertheticum]
MKINSSVEIGKSKIQGKILEISPDNKSVLVSHIISSDGILKPIKQWYSNDMVTEVDLHTEAEDVFKSMEDKGMSSQEISDLVSAGGNVFRDKAVLLGILPGEES